MGSQEMPRKWTWVVSNVVSGYALGLVGIYFDEASLFSHLSVLSSDLESYL